jgi:hypothetical protein
MVREKGQCSKKENRVPGFSRSVVLLAGSLLAFASCQTVPIAPKRTSDQVGMLVIPLEFKNESGEQLEEVMSLNFDRVDDSKTGQLLDFHDDYGFITTVAPGEHRITKMLLRWKASNQIVQQMELNIPFTINAGEITILPLMFNVTFSSKGRFFALHNLLHDQLVAIQADLQNYQHIETWTMGPLPSQ